jgi:hypothetical protein
MSLKGMIKMSKIGTAKHVKANGCINRKMPIPTMSCDIHLYSKYSVIYI